MTRTGIYPTVRQPSLATLISLESERLNSLSSKLHGLETWQPPGKHRDSVGDSPAQKNLISDHLNHFQTKLTPEGSLLFLEVAVLQT